MVDLYGGDCQNLIALACANDNLAGTGETIEATGLTVGNTYYFRVYDWSSGQRLRPRSAFVSSPPVPHHRTISVWMFFQRTCRWERP